MERLSRGEKEKFVGETGRSEQSWNTWIKLNWGRVIFNIEYQKYIIYYRLLGSKIIYSNIGTSFTDYGKHIKDDSLRKKWCILYRILGKNSLLGNTSNRIYKYRLLGSRPKREYPSLVKVNISRIDSEKGSKNRNYIYQLLDRIPKKRKSITG